MWLPLALAQIYQALMVLVTAWASRDSGIKVPSTSEALSAFALPALSEAVAADEESRKARKAYEDILALAARTGGKVTVTTEDNRNGIK